MKAKILTILLALFIVICWPALPIMVAVLIVFSASIVSAIVVLFFGLLLIVPLILLSLWPVAPFAAVKRRWKQKA